MKQSKTFLAEYILFRVYIFFHCLVNHSYAYAFDVCSDIHCFPSLTCIVFLLISCHVFFLLNTYMFTFNISLTITGEWLSKWRKSSYLYIDKYIKKFRLTRHPDNGSWRLQALLAQHKISARKLPPDFLQKSPELVYYGLGSCG